MSVRCRMNRLGIAFALVVACGGVDASAADSQVVTYEAFGAVGDGVADDLPAICKAHEHANRNGLSVRSNPKATYHLGRQALTAVIATNTDWGTSQFIIDDSVEVDDHRKTLFEVRSLLKPAKLAIKRLKRDQKRLDVRPEQDCYVLVYDNNVKRYRRRGRNQNSGTAQRDCFILRRDGSIEGNIDWDYSAVTRVVANPMDQDRLTIRGGRFTTIANQMRQDVGYNYWSRNIKILRSNTQVVGLEHRIKGEGEFGHPYSGFISVSECANVTLRDCFATGHKTYKTIGSTGQPVSMGSYDYTANSVVNFLMVGCRMDDILDRSLWGVIGTNFCKNIRLKDCVLSRMDTHMGVSGRYEILGCTLGHAGLNAIGRGRLVVEDSTLHGRSLVNLRSDYGSTWEGEVVINRCRWIPAAGSRTWPALLGVSNDGTHDFGYPCFMPKSIAIDRLLVDDSVVPSGYQGMYLLADPDGNKQGDPAKRPFPYRLTETIRIGTLKTASGKPPQVSADPWLRKSVSVINK
ncbi:hypothetical protein [Crateriforma conspicua]|uniref:hypothetical protein n=1 Tax=Crateriforma conspicua TaxID=2527996 RepID=UPI00119FE522|nr:hypothetical protein [Crateriforma conspicua]